MTNRTRQIPVPSTTGLTLHRALGYDLLVWAVSLGKEPGYRERTLELAALKTGESVLDVGCGTGNLAIAAKRLSGAAGRVCGIDASSEMIARACRKARKADVDVSFEQAVVEKLPFSDAAFDVVFSTTMLHHLPEKARRQCLGEIRRVLSPGGRLLALDFGGPVRERRSWVSKFHRHGRMDLQQLIPLVSQAGLHTIRSGPLEQSFGFISNLYFVLATVPATP